MLHVIRYNRRAAVDYARTWAFKRNPRFMDFTNLGGDCTNFASQCLYAGSGVMNYTPDTGWYYISPTRRAPAWSGVVFLGRFLTENKGRGPFA
ncbi:MAG: amidase, partial [Clostridiales bacterium]|nr:amidase [Clostridiales bacterium]